MSSKAPKPKSIVSKATEETVSSAKAKESSSKTKVAETDAKPTRKSEELAPKKPVTKAPAKTVEKRESAKKKTRTQVKKSPKIKTEKPKRDAPSLSCPGGMRLVALKRFPRGSLKRGRISGDKAIKSLGKAAHSALMATSTPVEARYRVRL